MHKGKDAKHGAIEQAEFSYYLKKRRGNPAIFIRMTNEQINERLQTRKYNPNDPPPPEQVIFTIQKKVVGTIENYVVFSGQAKAGKSTFLTAAIASAIAPYYSDIFGIKIQPIPGRQRVAFFDTESSRYDFHRVINRIKMFAERENLPENFDAYSMREDNPGAIRKMIVNYLENNPDCSVLIVDGFLDLCLNYNDEVETRLLTNWFKRITKRFQVLLIGVLHLSKGANNTIGHLGSNTDRWAQSTLIVEKDEQTRQFLLKPKLLRSADTFEPVCLQNVGGVWEQTFYTEPAPPPVSKKKAG